MEADELSTWLGSGLKVSDAIFVPILVPVDRLEVLSGMRFAFIAGKPSLFSEDAFDFMRSNEVLTISTRSECAEIARCVIAVQSEPRVQVIVSRAASIASSVQFSTAFRMMIREI